MWDELYLYQFLLPFLPPMAKLLVMEKPHKRPAVIISDLDGDHMPEIVAAYKQNGRTGAVILKNFYDTWYPVAYIKGKGYGISHLSAAPITGRGILDLIIGWQVGAIWSELDILEWTGKGFENILHEDLNYSKIEIADMPPKDGKYEIALWVHDTGEAYRTEVYQWGDGGLRPFPEAYPHYFKKVAAFYKKQLKEMPDAAMYWYYLADAQMKTGDVDAALESVETALKLDSPYPSKEVLLELKANLLLKKGGRAVSLYPAALKTVDGTKWGYIDNQGAFVIRPQYDSALDFQDNGLAIVQKEDRSGIINRFGKYVVQPKYSSIMPFSEGRATVIDDAGSKVMDESGKIITTKAYSFIGTYQEGRALFASTDTQGRYLYGYLDRQGKEVIPLQYESANDFKNGKALVKIKENQFALIGPNGEILHTYNYGTVGNPGDGLLPFQQDFNSKYGYIDINGNVVIQPQYTLAMPFSEERAVVNMSADIANQYGLIDKKGNFIIKPQYNDINQLGENRAAVGKALDKQKPYLGSKYAIADTVTGKFLTDFIYTGVMEYTEGYASAANDKKTFFIDKSGNIAKLLPIVAGSGTLSFAGELVKANVDLRTYYLDRTGKVVWQPDYIIPLNDQYKVLEKKYKPNKDYLVYYPEVSGMKSGTAQKNVNSKLKNLSQVKPVDSKTQLDYSYTGDFSIEFFKKDLLVFELYGYNFPFGAAHGMPSEIYPHVDLVSGKFYQLKDLFKPGSNYVKVLSDIIGKQIKSNPEYSYVFPDAYKGIKEDQPFYVKEDALYIYFTPYEIAPYAAGFPTFRIPYVEIMPIINTEGAFWKAFH